MFRALVSFVVLFVAAAAFITLIPSPFHHGRPATTEADALVQTGAQSEHARKVVRVVYPPSNTTTIPSQQAAIAVEPTLPATPLPPVVRAAVETHADQGSALAVADLTGQAPKIDLNTASADEIDRMAGGGRIGRAIVRHRPYQSVEDLLSKRVVRKGVYDRIKNQVASQ